MTVLSSGWTLVPTNSVSEILVYGSVIYLFVRQVLVFVALFGAMRRTPNWKQKLFRAAVHWLIAVAIVVSVMVVTGWIGWLEFIPN